MSLLQHRPRQDPWKVRQLRWFDAVEMRGIALFVAAVSLIVECTAESSICSGFGNEFCRNAECEVVPGAEDDFVCKCPRDNMYFNAAEKAMRI
ncbi:hypothetical protein MRX96_022403 [Rhipicephalus microplus]